MRFRSIALAASLVAATSVSALAQTTTTVTINGKSPAGDTPVTSGGAAAGYPAGTPNFYISPYAGVINVGTAEATVVSLNCVDFFHHVSIPETWTAWMTNLGDAAANNALLQYTRYGNLAGASAYANTLTLYKQAAWLTLQYDANAGAPTSANKTRAIQSAIWTLFNPYTMAASSSPTGSPAYDQFSFHGKAPSFTGPTAGLGEDDSSWWVSEAQAAIAANALSDADLQYFSVLTDNTNPWATDSKQEFVIHVTPEPSTVVLMLTGIIALFVVMRRRRAGAAAVESA
jgi:hypothetical protein